MNFSKAGGVKKKKKKAKLKTLLEYFVSQKIFHAKILGLTNYL